VRSLSPHLFAYFSCLQAEVPACLGAHILTTPLEVSREIFTAIAQVSGALVEIQLSFSTRHKRDHASVLSLN